MTKPKTKKPKFSWAPVNVSDSMWFYEGSRGIEIVVQIRRQKTGEYVAGLVQVIPWRIICASVKRYKTVLAYKKRNKK